MKFGQCITKSSDEVDQFSDETLLNITVLDDMYISATHLADRRSDKQLLDEYDEVSANLVQTISDQDYDKEICLKTPYLQTGERVHSIS